MRRLRKFLIRSNRAPDGAGDGPQAVAAGLAMPDLSDPAVVSARSLADWYMTTRAGRADMPAFEAELSEAETWAVVNYARGLSFQPVMAAEVPAGAGRLAADLVTGAPPVVDAAPFALARFSDGSALREPAGI